MQHSYGVDIFGTIAEKLSSMSNFSAMAKELVQNADDEASSFISFNFCDKGLYVTNGSRFTDDDFDRIRNIAARGKENEIHKTGTFGIGFVSVFQISDHPEVQSSGKKFVFYPEDKIVKETLSEIKDYTEFFLPWAFDLDSPVRRELRRQPVKTTDIHEYRSQLLEIIPSLLLFLRNLRHINILINSKLEYEYHRTDDKSYRNITQTLKGKTTNIRRWLVYEYDPTDPEAQELKKESKVGIAFPLSKDEREKGGMLYDILPTGLYIGYKFHINGDFYPTPDRQKIVVDGEPQKVRWNNKVIINIGNLLISCLTDLKSRLEIEELYEFFPDNNYVNNNLPALVNIKNIFLKSAINEKIVPDETCNWYKPDSIYLIDSKDDNERRTLNDLNIPVVTSRLRSKWTLLQQGLGVKSLDLSMMIIYIQKKNIKASIVQSNAPKPFNTREGLYNTLLFLQDRLKNKSEEKFLVSFSQLPICLNQTGHLNSFAQLKLITPSIEKVIPKLDGDILVNSEFLSKYKDINEVILRLSSEYSWRDVIDLVYNKTPVQINSLNENNTLNLRELYDFLANHETEILKDAVYKEKLIKSCIFKTNNQFKPLSGLCLSGNYKDIIGLDIIISDALLNGKIKDFLRKLGVQSLDFPTYIVKYVADYYSNKEAWSVNDKRFELAEEIRNNFSLVSDNPHIRKLLKETKMVPCNDKEFHSPEEIYIKSELLDIVLGTNYFSPDAQKIGPKLDGWVEWLKLLGVNSIPKSEDVIHRVRILITKNTPENIRDIEQLFYYLCELFDQDDFQDAKLYSPLRTLEWLPTENIDDHYYFPSEVYLQFSKHLFYSQAKFVPFKQSAKIRGEFLKFIGIGNYPSTFQTIKHLIYLADHNIVPDGKVSNIYNIYRDLSPRSDKLPNTEMNLLTGNKCVFVENIKEPGYKLGKHCFWNKHPFGEHRFQIKEELKNYFNFLKLTGIKNDPEPDDYISVLEDLSIIYGNNIVDSDTKILIQGIYVSLNASINTITDEQYQKLSQNKIILDRRGQLRLPGHLFFEDKGLTVDIFKELLQTELISKENNTWQLFQKMGVRHLSDATRPSDFKPSSDQSLDQSAMDLIKNRGKAIITIIETQKKDFDSGWKSEILDNLQIFDASQLSVKYKVTIEGKPIYSQQKFEKSFYDEPTLRLFLAKNCLGKERTYEVARNVAYILNSEIDPCHMLPVLVEVLDPSRTNESVEKYLRQVGYDIVSVASTPAIALPIEASPQTQSSNNESENLAENGTPAEQKESDINVETKPDDFENKADELLKGLDGHEHTGPHRKHQIKENAKEIDLKRKAWLNERLQHDYSSQPTRESEYPIENHILTPEERDHHRKKAQIFYNRQIQDLTSRLMELEEGNGPRDYSIYGKDWDEISKLIRARDENTCRRCGLSEADGITLAVHHIFPRKEGGSNWHSNLITLCRVCHGEVEERPWLL